MKRRLKVGREVVIAFATIFSVLTAACSGPSSLPTASPLQTSSLQANGSSSQRATSTRIHASDVTTDSKYGKTPLGQTPTDAQFRAALSSDAVLRSQVASADTAMLNKSPQNTSLVLNYIMAVEGVKKPSALNIDYLYGIASNGAVVKIPIQQEAAATDPDGDSMLVLGNLMLSNLVTGQANAFGPSTAFSTTVQPDGYINELGAQWWLTYASLKSTFIQGNSAIFAILLSRLSIRCGLLSGRSRGRDVWASRGVRNMVRRERDNRFRSRGLGYSKTDRPECRVRSLQNGRQ